MRLRFHSLLGRLTHATCVTLGSLTLTLTLTLTRHATRGVGERDVRGACRGSDRCRRIRRNDTRRCSGLGGALCFELSTGTQHALSRRCGQQLIGDVVLPREN